MTRPTIEDVKRRHLADMTAAQRAEFAETSESTHLALEVGEQVRDARKAAGSQSANSQPARERVEPRSPVSNPVEPERRSQPC